VVFPTVPCRSGVIFSLTGTRACGPGALTRGDGPAPTTSANSRKSGQVGAVLHWSWPRPRVGPPERCFAGGRTRPTNKLSAQLLPLDKAVPRVVTSQHDQQSSPVCSTHAWKHSQQRCHRAQRAATAEAQPGGLLTDHLDSAPRSALAPSTALAQPSRARASSAQRRARATRPKPKHPVEARTAKETRRCPR